jgi:uncharacterized protein
MSENTPAPGTIVWTDLTVPDADRVHEFYARVVGWKPQPVEMGGYSDYSMVSPDGGSAVGVCHARGVNANLPPAWLVYVQVADLEESLRGCRELGGEVIVEPRSLGDSGRMAVIRDPAGAVLALVGPAKPD